MNQQDTNKVNKIGELGAMLMWQDMLSATLGVYDLPKEEAIKAMIECLAVEAAETLAHFLTKTKPWKPQVVNMDEVKEEAVDILHFLLAFFNLMDMGPEAIVEEYRRKNLINYERVAAKMAALKASQDEAK
jgi:NTP pyrophosphatase (non-canonical NTP hydrolase)